MGKGSTQRPKQISESELADRWASTFSIPASHLSPDGYILTDFAVSGIRQMRAAERDEIIKLADTVRFGPF